MINNDLCPHVSPGNLGSLYWALWRVRPQTTTLNDPKTYVISMSRQGHCSWLAMSCAMPLASTTVTMSSTRPNQYLVWVCLGTRLDAFMMHVQSFSCVKMANWPNLANPLALICFVQDQDQMPTRAVVPACGFHKHIRTFGMVSFACPTCWSQLDHSKNLCQSFWLSEASFLA